MAYNLDLEDRIDALISQFGDITKKKMFGGIGYLLSGNMCFGIHKEFLIVRTTVEKAEKLLQSDDVFVFDITGKAMKGWVMISPDALETEDQLLDMLKIGAEFTRTLPPK